MSEYTMTDVRALVRSFLEEGELEQARDELNSILSTIDGTDLPLKVEVYAHLGVLSEKMGNKTEALKYFMTGYKLDNGNFAILIGLMRNLIRRKDTARIVKLLSKILNHFAQAEPSKKLVAFLYRLGTLLLEAERAKDAQVVLRRALELDSSALSVLDALAKAAKLMDDPLLESEYLHLLGQKQEQAELAQEAYRTWLCLADVLERKLDSPKRALESYRRALAINAEELQPLKKVAQLLVKERQFDEAKPVYRHIAQLDKENAAEIYLAAAKAMRDADEENPAVLEYYRLAHEADIEDADIFELLEMNLEAFGELDELDKLYRKMLHTIGDEDPERKVELWQKLGNLLVNRGDDLEEAIKVWEIVQALSPSDPIAETRLADLYARSPKHHEDVVDMAWEKIEENPHDRDAYLTLWRSALEAEKFDEAYCFAAANYYLGGTTSTAGEFYQKNKQDSEIEVKQPIDRAKWSSLLLHEQARHSFGQIFSVLFHHAAGFMPESLKTEGIKKRDKINLDIDIQFSLAVRYALHALGLAEPEIYTKADFGPGIEVLPVQPASLAIGEDSFEDFPPRILKFLVTSNLVFSRPDFLSLLVFDEETAVNYLEAAAKWALNDYRSRIDAKTLAPFQKKIQKSVPRKLKERFVSYAKDYAAISEDFDLSAWKRAMVLSGFRAGLLLSSDLPSASRALKKYQKSYFGLERDDILNDLLLFSISPDYFKLRRHLGLSIV